MILNIYQALGCGMIQYTHISVKMWQWWGWRRTEVTSVWNTVSSIYGHCKLLFDLSFLFISKFFKGTLPMKYLERHTCMLNAPSIKLLCASVCGWCQGQGGVPVWLDGDFQLASSLNKYFCQWERECVRGNTTRDQGGKKIAVGPRLCSGVRGSWSRQKA